MTKKALIETGRPDALKEKQRQDHMAAYDPSISSLPPPMMTSKNDTPNMSSGVTYDDILRQTEVDRSVPAPPPPITESATPVQPVQQATPVQPPMYQAEDSAPTFQPVQQYQDYPTSAYQMVPPPAQRMFPGRSSNSARAMLWQYKDVILVAVIVFVLIKWVAPKAGQSLPQVYSDGRLSTLGICLIATLSGAAYRIGDELTRP
jgi:hypothetical protein